MLRPIQLLLILLMLAFMPLQTWASGVVRTVDAVEHVAVRQDTAPATGAMHLAGAEAHAAAVTTLVAVTQDRAPAGGPADPGSGTPADHGSAGDNERPGIDFAESLLPTPAPRMAPATARLGLPGYAAVTLPDPHLPLLPRPPRG